MCNDKLLKTIFWIDYWFVKDKKENYGFDELEGILFDEIVEKWKDSNKLNLFESIKDKYGKKLFDVIDKIVKWNLLKDWKEIAENEKASTIDDLIRLLWNTLDNNFKYTSKKNQDGSVQFYCTKCPIHDLGKELNCTELLYYLVCKGDPYVAEGINPKIGFKRIKTLMQGDELCDHFYYYK